MPPFLPYGGHSLVVNFPFQLWFLGLFLVENLGLSLTLVNVPKFLKYEHLSKLQLRFVMLIFFSPDYEKIIAFICGNLRMSI